MIRVVGSKIITRDNHYVPRFYLKGWSANGSTILTYDLVVKNERVPHWKHCQIKSMACWRDFYSQTADGVVSDAFERMLNSEYETPSIRAFEKVKKNEYVERKDIDSLVNYLVAQMVRTPQWYLSMAKLESALFPEVATKAVREVLDRCSTEWQCKDGSACEDGLEESSSARLSIPIKAELTKDGGPVVVESYSGRTSNLAFATRVLDGVVGNTIRSCCWTVQRCPEGYFLPTSDNPVVVAGSLGSGGLGIEAGAGVRGTVIFMPIDPSHLLFTVRGFTPQRIESAFWELLSTGEIVKLITLNATRYIFARCPIQEVERIRSRIADAEYWKELEKERKEWHDIQSELEAEYCGK